ncbi:hypothetical protein Thiowin_03660 [Thiorhodovibrio winogradskyi]|uniref:DUF3782 domain-containing protein n=1 Tax=Thiorhodovibrio winogradskyi TaxID=77007 RepID=A0ABZ0SEP8_9GAMM|nr:DUF3782 domain-containing protein [Thiorhodovibrio winogradskyi]
MNAESLKDAIRRELPDLLRNDAPFRDELLALTRRHHPERGETEDWFHEMLGELRRDREEQSRRWEEQKAKDERDRAEQARKWDEQNRKWEEHKAQAEQDRAEQARKWDEQNRKWEEHKAQAEQDRAEQARKWEEANQHFDRVHEEIMAQAKRFDRGIGALGARWGIHSERAFRNALAGILEVSFGVEVINVNEFDDTGVVFGRPEQIELDIIIQNGLLLICELKSSIDKAGMYSFERKARFYEERHHRQAQRLIVISPMIDDRARKVAERLGIEIYHDSTDLTSLDAS